MYDWIIEADIVRYRRQLDEIAITEEGKRDKLNALLAEAERRLHGKSERPRRPDRSDSNASIGPEAAGIPAHAHK